jgi:hypothetical protein
MHPRFSYANVVSSIALFLVLTGGAAYALDGSNTVFSDDIVNGEVTNNDLAANAVGSGKINDGSVKNADLGAGASSSNTIADGGVQGIDVKSGTLTGADVEDDSLTNADIDESTLNDPLDPGVEVCQTDGPLHLVGDSVAPVCTLGALTVSAQCAVDVSDPVAMINVQTSVDDAFIVWGPDTNDQPDFDNSNSIFSVSATNATGPVASKSSVLFGAPDGTQATGFLGGRANPVEDSCDLVVSLVGK